MARPFQTLQRLFRELKRRKVFRVAGVYAVVGFVLVQAADYVFRALLFPPWAHRLLVVLVLFGFPIALVLAWAFEVTPEGVRREPDGQLTGGEAGESGQETAAAYRLLVGLGALAAALTGGWYLIGSSGSSPEIGERSLAVLPFHVSAPEADTWRDGMVSLLSTNIDGAAGIRTIADRTVFATVEERGYTARSMSTGEALQVARGVGAQYAVIGSASQLGEELQLTARLHRTRSGERIEQVTVTGPADSVTSLSDRLTREVLSALLGGGLPSVDLASLTTSSLPALKSYLSGERHFREGDYGSAVSDYEAAVASDSTFGLAHARLARAHGWLSELDLADHHRRRAYELSDRLPERERRLLRARYDWLSRGRVMAGADSLRRLTEVYPDDPTVWHELGEALFHGWIPKHWREVESAFQRAAGLDPNVAPYRHHLVDMAFFVDHDSALAAERIAAHPGTIRKELYQITLAIVFGAPERRQEALVRLDSVELPAGRWPLWPVRANLQHPADAQLRLRVARRLAEREDLNSRGHPPFLLPSSLQVGRISSAPREREELGAGAESRLCTLAMSTTLGMPVPDSVIEPLAPPSPPSPAADEVSLRRLRCAGYYYVEQGRTEALESLMSELRKRSSSTRDTSEEGSTGARRILAELDGYRAWKAGDPRRAEELVSGFNASRWAGAIWRGDLYRDLDELEKAERWYVGAWTHPVSHERLGQLYEEMGRQEEAADAYRRFIAAWKDADEELQPRVEEARQRVQALTDGEEDDR